MTVILGTIIVEKWRLPALDVHDVQPKIMGKNYSSATCSVSHRDAFVSSHKLGLLCCLNAILYQVESRANLTAGVGHLSFATGIN